MKAKKDNFIIDVVPLTKIPLATHQSFSYLADGKLPVGTLVGVPLFRRKVEGVVVGTRTDFHRLGNIELKKIDKIIEEDFLDDKQISLANFISDYYFSPLGVVMKNFVPKRARTRNSKLVISNSDKKQNNIVLTIAQKDAVERIASCQLPVASCLLFGPSGSGKTEVYIHSILKLRKKNPDLQFLIFVPEKTLTPQAIERYGAYFGPSEIVVLSSNISKGQYYSNWLKIRDCEAKIVIGTRMAVFAPYKQLGLIVIDEEQDMSYKQWDMNPRYDSRTVAEKLAEVHRCPLIRGSATPSVESYYRAANNEGLKLITIPILQLPNTRRQVTEAVLVDMKKERWQKNYSCISKKLKSEIAYALRNGQQTILLINRQGMSSFAVCTTCKTVMKCPHCDRALAFDQTGVYRCVHCSHKTSVIPKCQKCQGISFQNVGLGTQKVEKEVSDMFPGASIKRIDSQAIGGRNFQKNIYDDFSAGKIDILVGTQMISKGWDLPRVSLVGIIDTDNMLAFPDFSAGEKAFGNIVQVSGRVARPGSKYPGVAVIQTYQPENPILRYAAEKNFLGFYGTEIEERRVFSYPPHGRLIKLVCQGFDKKKTEIEAGRIFDLIGGIEKISVSRAQEAFIGKIRGRFRMQIVVKYPPDMVFPKKLAGELKKLPPEWIVDVDPISII